jgi:hypothetical protein
MKKTCPFIITAENPNLLKRNDKYLRLNSYFRLTSAVPSEYSDISTNSSDGGGGVELNDKTVSIADRFGDNRKQVTPFRVDSRPLIVGHHGGGGGGKTPSSVVPVSAALSEDSSVGGGDGGCSSSSCGEESGVNGDVKRPADKAYLIANELLTTEIHYVSRLHLIDQVR